MPKKSNYNYIKPELKALETENIIYPTFDTEVNFLKGESLALFGSKKYKKRKFRPFWGIGIVYRIVRGDKGDLVYINFGVSKDHKPKLIVCYENIARRQTLTLKRGMVCEVYGMCRYYFTEFELNGKKQVGARMGLFARGINGWYTPSVLDVRKMPQNEDIVAPSEKEEELMNTFEDVLNEFLNGTEVDEE